MRIEDIARLTQSKGAKTQMPDQSITCPSCGHVNPAGAKTCDVCTLPLGIIPGTWDEATRAVGSSGQGGEGGSFAPGTLIAKRYEVLLKLGRGGMGTVYLVRDQMLQGRKMALKLISPSLLKDSAAVARFSREVEASHLMNHENVVSVFQLDRCGEHIFFTMAYIQGETLREALIKRQNRGQVFSLTETLQIALPVLAALAHAHGKGVIHRDLKPENIMVHIDFPVVSVKVLDFGLARIMSPSRMSSTAQALGTVYYMSPEQLSGSGKVDGRTDLFALGVIIYEMLTGEIPTGLFEMPSEIFPDLPAEIDAIITKLLSSNPEGRYKDISSLRKALDELIAASDLNEEAAWADLAPEMQNESLNEEAEQVFKKAQSCLACSDFSGAEAVLQEAGHIVQEYGKLKKISQDLESAKSAYKNALLSFENFLAQGDVGQARALVESVRVYSAEASIIEIWSSRIEAFEDRQNEAFKMLKVKVAVGVIIFLVLLVMIYR